MSMLLTFQRPSNLITLKSENLKSYWLSLDETVAWHPNEYILKKT